METKFIKGEWYLQEFTDAYTNIVRSNQGKGFETAWVCNIHGSSKENRPTAQLISASPNLLQALQNLSEKTQELIGHCVDQGFIDWEDESIDGVIQMNQALSESLQAIKKAIGE